MPMLTPPQLAELEKLGPAIVRLRLQVATGEYWKAQMTGFHSGLINRVEVEEWLSQKDREDAEREQATRKTARIAVAGIVGVIAATAVGFLMIWLRNSGTELGQWWRVQ